MAIHQGQFVEVRRGSSRRSTTASPSIADDAQGEQIEVLWDAEIGAKVIEVGRGAPGSPEVLAAYLRDRRRPRSPAGAVPGRAPATAARQPADRLCKTVEAGLVVRELLLRRRIDLSRRRLIGELRHRRSFSVNPWITGSRFLTDESYAAGLLPRALHPRQGPPLRRPPARRTRHRLSARSIVCAPGRCGRSLVGVMPIRSLISKAAVLNPAQTQIICDAFDGAWAIVQGLGSPLAEPAMSLSTRTILARRIIEMAQQGLMDVDGLRDDALRTCICQSEFEWRPGHQLSFFRGYGAGP